MGIEFEPQNLNDSGVSDGFRNYDAALQELFTIDIYPKKTDPTVKITLVPVIGPAQREFATQEKINPLHLEQENIKSDRTVKLPATSLSRLNWEMDLSRWSRADFRRLKWTNNLDRVQQGPRPIPYNVLYQFDIWTKYRSTMNQILQKIILKFGRREVWIGVDLGEQWGTIRVPVKLGFGGPHEMTNYELEEMEDRTIRNVLTFTLQAWIPTETYMIPTVTRLIADETYPSPSGNEIESNPITYELEPKDTIP